MLAVPAVAQQATATDEAEQQRGARTVFTNADLPPPLPTGTPPAPEPASSPEQDLMSLGAPPAPATAGLSYASHRDRDGHGEGWWRHRAAELELRLYEAQLEAHKAHVAYVKGKVLIDPQVPVRSRAATQHMREIEAEREGLNEELRQAGGLPGWLSRPGGTPSTEPLPAPTVELPGGVNPGDVLTWTPVPNAAFYLVELQCLDCCGLLGPCEALTLDVTQASVAVPAEARGTGRWRLRALDAAGFGGDWSAWHQYAPRAE
jgi:hypothetical protein